MKKFYSVIMFICFFNVLYAEKVSNKEFYAKLKTHGRSKKAFEYIKKNFKPGKIKTIKKEVLKKIIPGNWREGESGAIFFKKDSTF